MSSFKKRKNKNGVMFFISFLLIAVLSVAVIFAFVKIDKNEKTKTLDSNRFTYSIGLLDETKGDYVQGTSSIYTKDFYNVDGLIIDVDEDATVKYKLYFFDENQELISTSEELSSDFDSTTTPEGAKYFKVMITPTNDVEVSRSEISTYASQLTVTINK